MQLLLDRKWKKEGYTIGKLYINGLEFSDTLEDRDRGLKQSMPLSEIQQRKVYSQTSIPTGTYTILLTHSPKFYSRAWAVKYGGKVPELQEVRGFSGIRIHPMNWPQDTLGCIGVGRNTVKGGITQSTVYYYKLLDNYLLPAIKRHEPVTITIR